MKKRFVVSIETVKIKNFLFSTNKLKVIRGASYLLDYLNQIEVPKILSTDFKIKEEDIIYVGAGNAKFFMYDEEEVEKLENRIKELYGLLAPGVHIACAHTETSYGTKNKNNENENKVWNDLEKLGKMIAIEKSKGFDIKNIDMPFLKKCELCGDNPSQINADNISEDIKIITTNNSEVDKYSEDLAIRDLEYLQQQVKNLAPKTGLICEECFRKINAANHIKKDNDKNIDIGFYQYLNNNKIELRKTDELDDYGDSKSFIGFMYSDGDGLGDFLKNVSQFYKVRANSEEEYIEFLKIFSKTLDESTKKALFKAVEETFKNNPEKEKKGEFLIVGGDDVCAIFEAQLAIEISRLFQGYFEIMMEEGMRKKIKNLPDKMPRITSSSGVVIAKCKTPIYQLFDQAMVLQKNAKKKRHQFRMENPQEVETGFIDFQVIGSEGCVDINRFRNSLIKNGNLFIERPYSIRDLDVENIKPLSYLIEIVEKLKKDKFPKTKIRQIYELKRSDKEEFEKKLEIVDIISKMDENNIKTMMKYFDIDIEDYKHFNHLFNNIFDILEVYDFIGGVNNGN